MPSHPYMYTTIPKTYSWAPEKQHLSQCCAYSLLLARTRTSTVSTHPYLYSGVALLLFHRMPPDSCHSHRRQASWLTATIRKTVREQGPIVASNPHQSHGTLYSAVVVGVLHVEGTLCAVASGVLCGSRVTT